MDIHAIASVPRRYGAAVMLAIAATVVAMVVNPYIGAFPTPPYLVGVMVAAAYGGAGPGLLAVVLTTCSLALMGTGTARGAFGVGEVAELVGFVVAALIVTSLAAARSATRRRLQRTLEDLSKIDRAKDEFIAALSHELRTPLTSMLGWVTMLKDKSLDGDTRKVAIESIEHSARTQKMIVDDLLDVSRIILGKFSIIKKPILLEDVVNDAVDVIRPTAAQKGIHLEIRHSEKPLLLDADGDRLKQVVWNLLSNAVKFTPAGRSIHVFTSLLHDRAMVEVTDEGEGIDPALEPYLFDRFRQGDGSTRKGGLGLGLAIAKSLVEEHGGSIRATSRGKGKGSTFRVTLPLDHERVELDQVHLPGDSFAASTGQAGDFTKPNPTVLGETSV